VKCRKGNYNEACHMIVELSMQVIEAGLPLLSQPSMQGIVHEFASRAEEVTARAKTILVQISIAIRVRIG